MRLRIVHQNQENRGGKEQAMENEMVEMERMEEVQMGFTPEGEFIREEFLPMKPGPASAYDPLLVSGKRKRKPKEIVDDFPPVIRRKPTPSNSKHKDGTLGPAGTSISKEETTINGSSSSLLSKTTTMIGAEEIQLSLGDEQLTFLKTLVRSHVGSCFWMGLPVLFCKLHLPMKDSIVVLENETGEEFPIKYIANKTGLSAGWRKFVGGNKLLEGDVLVFHLVGSCRFKVYIVRVNDLNEVDGALSLLILDSQTKQNDADVPNKKKKRPKSLPSTVGQKKKQKHGQSVPQSTVPEEHSGNDSDEVASEVVEGSKFSESASLFKEVKTFDEFHIVVNGMCVDFEIPEHIRRKYYDLCCCKNCFLHDHLLPGLNSKLAASVIVEVVNITQAIRDCKLTTPRNDFEVWEKSLRSFELLGLNVGFLQVRLERLVSIAFDSDGALYTMRYWDAQMDRISTENKIQSLEAKLVVLKELSSKYDDDIDKLRMTAERFELMFQEEVEAPW